MGLSEAGYGFLPVTACDAAVLAPFDCGKPNLNEFLINTAAEWHRQHFSFTNVVFHSDYAGPIAYFTLCNDQIQLNESEYFALGANSEKQLTHLPAVKIGRLAVIEPMQRTGVGREVMKLIRGEILIASAVSAARLIVVDADNTPNVISFYERDGFERSLWAEKQARSQGGKKQPVTVKMLRDVLAP